MLSYIFHHFHFLTNEWNFIWKKNCAYWSPNLTCVSQRRFYFSYQWYCLKFMKFKQIFQHFEFFYLSLIFICLVMKCYTSCSLNCNRFFPSCSTQWTENLIPHNFFIGKYLSFFLAVLFSVAVKFFAGAINLLVMTLLWNCGAFLIDVRDSVYLHHTWSLKRYSLWI